MGSLLGQAPLSGLTESLANIGRTSLACGMHSIAQILREFYTVKLQCRGCQRVTALGLDRLLAMSRTNDDMTVWRERFRCSGCGAKNPHFSTVNTHLTPPPHNEGWNPLTQTWNSVLEKPGADV